MLLTLLTLLSPSAQAQEVASVVCKYDGTAIKASASTCACLAKPDTSTDWWGTRRSSAGARYNLTKGLDSVQGTCFDINTRASSPSDEKYLESRASSVLKPITRNVVTGDTSGWYWLERDVDHDQIVWVDPNPIGNPPANGDDWPFLFLESLGAMWVYRDIETGLVYARSAAHPAGSQPTHVFVGDSDDNQIADVVVTFENGDVWELDNVVDPNVVYEAPADEDDSTGSCATDLGDACGGQSPDGCWCDAVCSDYGDCCDDITAVCMP